MPSVEDVCNVGFANCLDRDKRCCNNKNRSLYKSIFDSAALSIFAVLLASSNIRRCESYAYLFVLNASHIVKPVSYTHLTLPTIYSV